MDNQSKIDQEALVPIARDAMVPAARDGGSGGGLRIPLVLKWSLIGGACAVGAIICVATVAAQHGGGRDEDPAQAPAPAPPAATAPAAPTAASAAPTWNQPPQPPQKQDFHLIPFFKREDKNHNGIIQGPELIDAEHKLTGHFNVDNATFEALLVELGTAGYGPVDFCTFKALLWLFHAHALFPQSDKDKDGEIDGRETLLLAKRIEGNYGLTDEHYKRLFNQADANEDGTLDVHEAQSLIGTLDPLIGEKWASRFLHMFDASHSGSLEGAELQKAMARIAKAWHMDKFHAQALLNAADASADNKLVKSELVALFRELKREACIERTMKHLPYTTAPPTFY
jgi:Ca2+-binding EF-hand superfamily protein